MCVPLQFAHSHYPDASEFYRMHEENGGTRNFDLAADGAGTRNAVKIFAGLN
jgi:hypothetical protein